MSFNNSLHNMSSNFSNNSNSNNSNIASLGNADLYEKSFKKITLYNFVFMAICLIVSTIVVFMKYPTDEIIENRDIIISIVVTSLIFSNTFILLGSYIAKKLKVTPFLELIIALISFILGYVIGYYAGKSIGKLIQNKNKPKVDKDTAALQAAIKKSKEAKMKKLTYNKSEMEAKEEYEKAKTTIMGKIKSILGEKKKKKIKLNSFPFKYSYGLSFGFYIEAQPPSVGNSSERFVNILDYGGKPSIQYKGNTNELKITFRLKDKTETEILLYNELKYQKWNHFIVNYDHGTVDIFINDKLVATQPSIAPYMVHDDVVVGQDKGLNGGIKEVKYFPEPINLKTIKHLFRMY